MSNSQFNQSQAWADSLAQQKVYFHTTADLGYVQNFGPIIAPFYKQAVKARIFDLVAVKETDTVLDAGCGVGCLGQIALGLGLDISAWVGIDQVEEFVKRASNWYPKAVVGSLTQIPLSDESVDCILCSEVIEHIPNYEKAIFEMMRVLKPRGVVVLTTPNGYSLSERIKSLVKQGVRHCRV